MEILENLVKFNTIKDKENKEINEYIKKYLEALGFDCMYEGKYLIMSIGKSPKIGFLGHTDTVEYIDGWDTDPFVLTKKGDFYYGLRSCRYERWNCSNVKSRKPN